jgi:hypothetical protein
MNGRGYPAREGRRPVLPTQPIISNSLLGHKNFSCYNEMIGILILAGF